MAGDTLHPLTIEGVRQGDASESPTVICLDELGRALEIPVGLCESLAIQRALAAKPSPRPLTHDLLLTLAERLDAPVARVVIDDYSGGAYYARLFLASADGPVILDCRPSDGLALALRANAPILASEFVMTAR